MTKKNNYNFPAKEIRQELKRKRGIVNIIVPESADPLEKTKYSISQSILTYHLENKKPLAVMVEEIDISTLTEKKLLDICRGKISSFAWGELIIYANNLRINFIPCYNCGVNLFPVLLESLILTLKDQESLPWENAYQPTQPPANNYCVHHHFNNSCH